METTLKIGNYDILSEIAHGGFGRTLLAENPEGKRVVLKQFNPQQHNIGSQALRLFDQECDRLKEVGCHEQIPSFIEYFEEGGNRYIVQALVDGSTLKNELRESGPFSEAQIIALLKDILPVIEFVHSKNVIHRDIKPDNIIRRSVDGKLFLVDFGASKPVSDTVLAKTGTMIGSPLFVAPEQSRGKATYASDIYSLGLTCAHLLTNISPFDLVDEDDGRWVWQDYCTENVSENLAKIINTMLKRGLKDRYKSARSVLTELEEIELQDLAVNNKVVIIQEFLEENFTNLEEWREQVSQAAKKYESYSEEKQRQLLIDHIRAHNFFPFLSAERILEDAESIKGKKFDAVAILSGRQYLIKTRDINTGRDTIKYKWGPKIKYKWGPKWSGTHSSKELARADHGPGPLTNVKRKVVAALAVTALATTGIAVWRFTNVPIAQETPTVLEQLSERPESEGGDELVADEVFPKEFTFGVDFLSVVIELMIGLLLAVGFVGILYKLSLKVDRQ